MLIEFKVSNYRSIYKTQTFSMVADKDSTHQDSNSTLSHAPGIPRLLRSAVVYGANASGKSNFVMALQFMKYMVLNSATNIQEGQTLNISPFRFEPAAINEPSEFEINIVENGIRYEYGFSLNSSCILKEWLLVYIKDKGQRWFEREYDEATKSDTWYFGSHFLGGSSQKKLWSSSTRSNTLFLSNAINFNNEQLKPIFNWFLNNFITVLNNSLNATYTIEKISQGLDKNEILNLLKASDLGIVDIELKKSKNHNFHIKFDKNKNPIIENQSSDAWTPIFIHQGKNGSRIPMMQHELSQGTQRLFSYASPIIDILRHGKTLIIDELENSLHPKMVRFLINLVQNNDLNKNNAQLIFTTHNVSLLDPHLFRRDQIWFMEKDQEQASHLYPLTDFSPRKNEDFEKGYMLGRYGALPFFGEFHF